MAIIHETKIDGQSAVTLHQTGRGKRTQFTVVYGSDIKGNLSYVQGAKEYGECIFHALACAGLLDNEGA